MFNLWGTLSVLNACFVLGLGKLDEPPCFFIIYIHAAGVKYHEHILVHVIFYQACLDGQELRVAHRKVSLPAGWLA